MTQGSPDPTGFNVTSVPNVFIDELMLSANPDFIKVYLYGLRNREITPSIKKTAEDLKIKEIDVVKAWTHWENAGLVHILGASLENFEPEYIFPKRQAEEKEIPRETDPDLQSITQYKPKFEKKENKTTYAEQSTAEADKERKEDDLAKSLKPPDNNNEEAAEPTAAEEVLRAEVRPSYTVAEIEHVAEHSEDVKYLFKMAEKILGKPLTYNEMNLLLSFHDWLMLPVEVIEVLLDYCVSNNHKNGRYLEKVAVDWADNGINTVEEAESYIKTFNGDYRDIMKSFGHTRRDPSAKEAAYMRKWLKEFKLPLVLVKEACEKTILQIGQPKFSYADKILQNWYDNEIKTIEESIKFEEEYKKNNKKEPVKKAGPKQKSRFANYEDREWDYEKLEKLAQDYLEKSL